LGMQKNIIIVATIWIFLIFLSFFSMLAIEKNLQKELAFQTARSFFDLIVMTREWNARHGGVYVPVTQKTRPNPYLDDQKRDIGVNNTLTLTKVNPAFMTRQLSEISKNEKVRISITSLDPLRPGNKPTKREKRALQEFEKGINEKGLIIGHDSEESFFYMAPLKTRKSCLKCHTAPKYKTKSNIGGISITLPYTRKIPWVPLLLSHIGIGIAGLFGIFVAGRKLSNAYEKIRMQASYDPLTGIANRRSFFDTLSREFQRSQRDGSVLSIIICDIDNFKAYNDFYGHDQGDISLQKVAHAIRDTLKRPSDICARYGGEEFIISLPNTDLNGAIHVAEKIRQAIREMKITHEKSPPDKIVTLSLGVATSEGTSTPEEIVKHSDSALYRAKENGRDQVREFDQDIFREQETSKKFI